MDSWCRRRPLLNLPDLAAFGKAIVALPLEFRLEPDAVGAISSLRGTTIEFTYGNAPRLNGVAVDYEHWPLFGGPFVESAVDSQKVALKHGSLRRTLDFKNLTVTDSFLLER